MTDSNAPTNEQVEAVQELKSRLADFEWVEENGSGGELEKLKNDFYLFQWLKMSKLNVEKAETAVRKSFLWRKKNRISSRIDDFPEDAAKEFPLYMHYTSKAGTPVCSVPGDPPWDIKKFVEGAPDACDKFIRYCALNTLTAENIWIKHNLKVSKKFTHPPENWTYIYSTAFPNLSQATSPRTVRCAIQVLKDIGTNFPPMIDKIIYVNVSTVASIVLKLIRPFLTFTRVEFYDKDEKKWRKALAEFIDLKQLRPELGGTNSI